DQGVGSFEINLGAFFTDLNTNLWQTNSNPYQYFDQALNINNQGAGFDDAMAIVRYRYMTNIQNLVGPFPGLDSLNIDEYANGTPGGTLMTGNGLYDDNNDTGAFGYPGADNPRHFFTSQDFFDPAKSSGANPSLVTRLRQAGNGLSSYDS